MKELFEKNYENVLIVSHGGTMKTLVHIFLKIDPKIAWSDLTPVGNTALFIFDINKKEKKLILNNCTEHLKEIGDGREEIGERK